MSQVPTWDELLLLGFHNPIIHACLSLYRAGQIDGKEDCLLLMVKMLHERNAALQKDNLHLLQLMPLNPIIVEEK